MKKGIFVSFLVAASLFCAAPARAEGAAEMVRALYAEYEKADATKASGPDQLDPKLYTARVRKQIARLNRACKGKDICGPDADFLVEGQDFKITEVKTRVVSASAERARVEARFKNFGGAIKRVFSMRREDGRWLIDDIDFGGGRRLKDELKPNL
jgi:hypothetical protein